MTHLRLDAETTARLQSLAPRECHVAGCRHVHPSCNLYRGTQS